MSRRLLPLLCVVLASSVADGTTAASRSGERYRVIASRPEAAALLADTTPEQMARLEQLNRADAAHLTRLRVLVAPVSWDEPSLADSVLPRRYAPANSSATFLVVHLPGQLFGAYEFGTLVRWGPVSSGRRDSVTNPGFFHLNWRSPGRHSTVNPDWFMPWYFRLPPPMALSTP